jgi:hypothetical protein
VFIIAEKTWAGGEEVKGVGVVRRDKELKLEEVEALHTPH